MYRISFIILFTHVYNVNNQDLKNQKKTYPPPSFYIYF